jgi:hypothetical protein
MSPLLQYRNDLFREIELAAKNKDSAAILNASRKLETLENLIALGERPSASQRELTNELPIGNGPEPSAKARGRYHRDTFVESARSRGIALEPVKGSIFKTPTGTRVGIAYAHEGNRRNRDRWFLGLPENQFDQAVLLCEGAGSEVTFFSLPRDFMHQRGTGLSSKDGQVKFNVFRRGSDYCLLIPRQPAVSLEPFRDRLSELK